MIDGRKAEETNYFTYKDGALYRNVAAGQILDRRRATRNAGRFKIYVDSFPNAALPYSNYYIADTKTGKVYDMEVLHILGGTLNKITEELKTKGEG